MRRKAGKALFIAELKNAPCRGFKFSADTNKEALQIAAKVIRERYPKSVLTKLSLEENLDLKTVWEKGIFIKELVQNDAGRS